jgi:hypothetical protein
MKNSVLGELVENEFPAFIIVELVKDLVSAVSQRSGVVGHENVSGSVFSVAYERVLRVGIAEDAEYQAFPRDYSVAVS